MTFSVSVQLKTQQNELQITSPLLLFIFCEMSWNKLLNQLPPLNNVYQGFSSPNLGSLTHNLLNFLNGLIHLQFLELFIIIFRDIHYHFQGYQDENLKLVSQQYRAWSDCTDVQAGLALYIQVAKANHFRFQQGKG